jgi:DNA-binding CsgD family transcriptional regulator
LTLSNDSNGDLHMMDLHSSDEANERSAGWVAFWREGVRASSMAIGLGDLATGRFIELSSRGAAILGTTVEAGHGLNYLALADPPGAAAESFRLAREGVIEGTRTRRRLRRPDGSAADVHATGWAIRSPFGPDLGLWMASDATASERDGGAEEVLAPSVPMSPRPERSNDRVTLGARWQIADASLRSDSLLGRSAAQLGACSLLELTHPDDVAPLLFALARATSDPSAQALVRLRHRDRGWRLVPVFPEIVERGGAVSVDLVVGAEESTPSYSGSHVPNQLRRIADQIEMAGLMASIADAKDVDGLAPSTDLSRRQWEIVARLVRGQRVPTIAAEMFLARSTVRNHLSAIFAKVGVHSQEELLARYGRRDGPGTPT